MRKRGRKSMANYDYEIVNGRKIRVRPKETVSEIDKNGFSADSRITSRLRSATVKTI